MKFKVGDRVKVVRYDDNWLDIHLGEVFVIIKTEVVGNKNWYTGKMLNNDVISWMEHEISRCVENVE